MASKYSTPISSDTEIPDPDHDATLIHIGLRSGTAVGNSLRADLDQIRKSPIRTCRPWRSVAPLTVASRILSPAERISWQPANSHTLVDSPSRATLTEVILLNSVQTSQRLASYKRAAKRRTEKDHRLQFQYKYLLTIPQTCSTVPWHCVLVGIDDGARVSLQHPDQLALPSRGGSIAWWPCPAPPWPPPPPRLLDVRKG